MKQIPQIIVPIVDNGSMVNENIFDILENKKTIIFGVPGAFTPTCSEQHLPGFLKLTKEIKSKGVDDIYCLSVNDKFVMKSWLLTYSDGNEIKGIADGNAEVSKALDMISDKSSSFMGLRSKRFAMIVENNYIIKTFVDISGAFLKTSAENILKYL
jgi:peroxiredoxin